MKILAPIDELKDIISKEYADGTFLSALSVNGNNLQYTLNGVDKLLTVPYASNAGDADTIDGYHVNFAGFVTNEDGSTTMVPSLMKQCNAYFSASVSSYWTKFAVFTAPNNNSTRIYTLLVGSEHQGSRYQGRGILELKFRNSSGTPSIYFFAVSGDIDCSCFRCYYPTTVSVGTEIELWVNVKRSWQSAVIKVLNETDAYTPINNIKMVVGKRTKVETPTLENYVEPTRISMAATADVATYVRAHNIQPTAETSYYPTFVGRFGSTINQNLGINDTITYRLIEGTADADGKASLWLGNATASGTAGNAWGCLKLYGSGTGATSMVAKNQTSSYTVYLPSANGTLVHHTSDTAIGSANLPVYVDSTGKVTACTASFLTTDNYATTLNSTYVKKAGDTMTGRLTVPYLTISDTAASAHIQFSRASYNYINAPANGIIAIMPNNGGQSSTAGYYFDGSKLYAGTTNSKALGSSTYRWSNVYSVKGDFASNEAGIIKLKRTTSAGAWIDYYHANQDTNYWRVGSNVLGLFSFAYNAVELGLKVNTSGQLVSEKATGTAPFVVASTTKVKNLNAELTNGFYKDDSLIESGADYKTNHTLTDDTNETWYIRMTISHYISSREKIYVKSNYNNLGGVVIFEVNSNNFTSYYSYYRSFYPASNNLHNVIGYKFVKGEGGINYLYLKLIGNAAAKCTIRTTFRSNYVTSVEKLASTDVADIVFDEFDDDKKVSHGYLNKSIRSYQTKTKVHQAFFSKESSVGAAIRFYGNNQTAVFSEVGSSTSTPFYINVNDALALSVDSSKLSVAGSIQPFSNNSATVGTSTLAFNTVYAYTFKSPTFVKIVGVDGVYLKFNDDNTKSVVLNSNAFKPFVDSNGLLDLGTTSARWKGIYGQTLDLTSNAAVGGTLSVTGVVTTGSTLYTHGKTGTTDGKAGFYAASGCIGITGATPAINFYYGNSTSVTSAITEYASGALRFPATLRAYTNSNAAVSIDWFRNGYASWRSTNTSGNLIFQCNYTTAVQSSWYDVFKLNYNSGNATLKGNLQPVTNNAQALGTGSLRWANAYLTNLNVSGTSNTGGIITAGNVRPSTNNTYTLGTSGYYWKEAYIHTLRRIQSAASSVPTIWVSSSNYDNTVLRVDYSQNANYYGDYGFSLKYMGTGGGYQNNLNLYADGATSATQNIAWSVNQYGQVAIRTAATNTSYDLYVNSTAYIPTLTTTTLKIGDATITWDSTNNALKVDKSLYSEAGVSALGIGVSEDGSATFDIVDNLTSTDANAALSANQGRVLNNSIASLATTVFNQNNRIITLEEGQPLLRNAIDSNSTAITALQESTFKSTTDANGITLTWFTSAGGSTDRTVTIPSWTGNGLDDYDGTLCLIDEYFVDDIKSYITANAGSTVTVVNNLTSTSTTSALSAAQGKVLNDKFASYMPKAGGDFVGNVCLSDSDIYGSENDYEYWRITYLGEATFTKVGFNANAYVTATTNNMTVRGVNAIKFQIGAAADTYIMNGSAFLPSTNNKYLLGTNTLKWKDLYLSGEANIDGGGNMRGSYTYYEAYLTGTYDDDSGDELWSIYADGSAYFTGVSDGSDMTRKNVISDYVLSLDSIVNAPCFTFTWIKDKDQNNVHVGTSAQYWQNVVPEIVHGEEGKNLGLEYSTLGVLMGISLAKEIVDLKTRIEELENKLKEYEINK